MDNKIRQLILSYNEPAPSNDLYNKIINRIKKEKMIYVRRRIFIFSLLAIFSMFGAFLSLQATTGELAYSNTFEFLSLLISDFDIVIAYWNNFLMAFLESLPYLTIASLLISIALFIESLKILTINIENIKQLKTLQYLKN